MKERTAQQIAVTWELLNGQVSDAVMEMLLEQFSAYDDSALLKALAKCRAECRGRITPADIISRIDDGRPGVEEAWAIADRARKDENATIVWTDDIAFTFGKIRHMEDDIAARMAFKEAYLRACDDSRDAGCEAVWTASLGSYDSRRGPLLEAVRLGRLRESTARQLFPELPEVAKNAPALPAPESKALPEVVEPETLDPSAVSDLCKSVIDKIGV